MKRVGSLNWGVHVRDTVTGLKGIIDTRAEWLNGCLRYSVQPKMKKADKETPKSYWVDEAQLEQIGEGVRRADKPEQVARTGGPTFENTSQRDKPTR